MKDIPLSCTLIHKNIMYINQNNWRTCGDFKGNILDYRYYIINHEVGRCLGLGHPTKTYL